MNEISSSVAFWMLDAWCRLTAQLHFAPFGENLINSSSVVVSKVAPKLNRVSFVNLDAAGQKQEWTLSLEGCKFFVGVPDEDKTDWLLELAIELRNGKRLLLAEKRG